MSLPHALGIFGAGIAAGTINTVVGSGTLITFPVLLAFGYAPVVANVSNCVGLVPGSVAGAIGFRRELRGQRARTIRLAAVALAGGVAGAILLLSLPASSFETVVPVIIATAIGLIIAQPRLARVLAARRSARPPSQSEHVGPWGIVGVFSSGVYGGYFGAQGLLLLAILGLALEDETLHRINALKVVLAGLVNFVAGAVFVFAADVAWLPALLIAAGSTLGGIAGARGGRRLPPAALRAVIVAVGILAIIRLL